MSDLSSGQRSVFSIGLAIRRLDSCNGITEYFRRLANHFADTNRPLDFLVGELILYPGTECVMEDLANAAALFSVCRKIHSPRDASRWVPVFFLQCAKYALRSSRATVLNTHSLDALFFASLLARARSGLTVVHTFHLTPDKKNRRALNNFFGRVLVRANPRVKFLTTSSEISESLTNECGIDSGRIEKIGYGIDINFLRPASPEEKRAARARFEIPPDCICISVVARVDPIKGQDVLVKAMCLIPNASEKFRVLLVGAGSQTWLPPIAEQAGLGAVFKMCGHIDPLPALHASDFFVLPSNWEGFAISCIEAMACGLAVIRTNTGGAADQIEKGKTGFVVPVGDAAALAARIVELSNDEALRSAMGKSARERAVSSFQMNTQLEKTREFFESLAANESGRRK